MDFGVKDVLYLVGLAFTVGAIVSRVSGRLTRVEAVQEGQAATLAAVATDIQRQRDATSGTREELAEMRGQLESIGQNVLALQGEVRGLPAATAALLRGGERRRS